MNDAWNDLSAPTECKDESDRRSYREQVRQFPPEQQPERFAAVRAAYERLKDLDSLVRLRLFEEGRHDSIEALIEEIGCQTPRPRFRLKDLIAVQKPGR